MVWRGQITYIEQLVNGDKRREQSIYEGEEIIEVMHNVYQAVMLNSRLDIVEIHIFRKEGQNTEVSDADKKREKISY